MCAKLYLLTSETCHIRDVVVCNLDEVELSSISFWLLKLNGSQDDLEQ